MLRARLPGRTRRARRVRERDPSTWLRARLPRFGGLGWLSCLVRRTNRKSHLKSLFVVRGRLLLPPREERPAQRHFWAQARAAPRRPGSASGSPAQDESEQATAAYRTASRLFQGRMCRSPTSAWNICGRTTCRWRSVPARREEALRGGPVRGGRAGRRRDVAGLLDDACRTFQEVLRLLERLRTRAAAAGLRGVRLQPRPGAGSGAASRTRRAPSASRSRSSRATPRAARYGALHAGRRARTVGRFTSRWPCGPTTPSARHVESGLEDVASVDFDDAGAARRRRAAAR